MIGNVLFWAQFLKDSTTMMYFSCHIFTHHSNDYWQKLTGDKGFPASLGQVKKKHLRPCLILKT